MKIGLNLLDRQLLVTGAMQTPERRLSCDAADAPSDKHTPLPG